MRAAAAEKVTELRRQIEVLQPNWVIPFASYVLFSHEENSHLNEGANSISDVVAVVRNAGAVPVVLYPSDRWEVGADHDPATAISRYETDRGDAATRPLAPPKLVALDQLQSASEEFLERMRRRNWLWTLRPLQWSGILRALAIYLSDLDATVEVQLFKSIRLLNRGPHGAALQMAADSLLFMLKNEFGADTLLINGRFRELEPGARHRLSRLFAVARHNNEGYSYPGRFFDLDYLRARLRRTGT